MKRIVLVAVLIFLSVSVLFAESEAQSPEQFNAGNFIRQNRLHQIGGYISLGLVAAAGISAAAELPFHPVLGYAAFGSSVASSLAGSLAYQDRLSEVWPHVVFNVLGVTALTLNAFVLEPGSTAHQISGYAAAGSFVLSYVSIILITR